MNRHKLDVLVESISKLDERALVDVLSRALPAFEPYKEEPSVKSSGFFLGIFTQESDEVSLEIVAYPDREEYGQTLGPDYGFAQRASSELHNVDYVSNFKRCLSPLDGRKVYLT